jgi:hypothetical protein
MTQDNIYPTFKTYIDLDGDDIPETDISARVVSDIKGKTGTPNNKESDRIANAGNVDFDIENKDGAYTGLELVGRVVSIHLEYEGRNKQVFTGRIHHEIGMDSGEILPLHLKVDVRDWMNTANNTQFSNLQVETNRTSSEALVLLLDALNNPPAGTNFDDGTEFFPNMFDGSSDNAKTYSELDKIAKSELGLLYLQYRVREFGEVLRFENKYSRTSNRAISRIPARVINPPLLKKRNDGNIGYLKYHGNGGTSGRIKVHKGQDASFSYIHKDADWRIGRNLINKFTVTNVFRLTDAAPVLLYKLQYPVKIGATERLTFNGTFTDPNGGTVIQAVETTPDNWTANASSDGLGVDLTVNIQVNYAAWSNNFELTFRNDGPAGYITNVEIWGKGIYKYNPNKMIEENEQSQIDLMLEVSDNLTREYSSDLVSSRVFARRAVGLYSFPRRELLSVSYDGNISEKLLMAFMYLDQGAKVNISEIYPEYDGDYYIQGIAFNLRLNGHVGFTWYVKEEVESFTTPITVTAPTDNSRNAIDFGIVPHLSNLQQFSYSFFVRRDATSSIFGVPIGKSVDTGTGRRGHYLILDNRTIKLISHKTPTDGRWDASNCIPNDLNWHHVAVTYDNTSDLYDPIIAVDGSAATVIEFSAPSGQTDDDSDCPFLLFNIGPDPAVPGQLYYYDFIGNFSMKDIRQYNRILSLSEISTISSSINDFTTVPDGKIFHAAFVVTDRLSNYIAQSLDTDDSIVDIVQGVTGIPYNEDTSTSATMITGEAI